MAIAFGAIAKGKNDGTVSTLTYTGPVVAGANTIGLVHCLTNSATGDIVTGITWGGVAMTRINIVASGDQRMYVYYILNPASAASVVITCSTTSTGIYGHALYYTGAKQSGQADSSATGTATGNLTLSTTTVADNSWKISVGRNNTSGVPGAGTGNTLREGDAAHAIGTGDGNADVTPAGSTSMEWTAGAGTTWGIIYSIAPSTTTVFSARVAAAADDAVERSDNTNFNTNPVLALGAGLVYGRSGAAGNPFWYSGFRFPSVTIPVGATITSAALNFFARSAFSMTTGITVAIYANAVDNAADFASSADVDGRALSTATVNWTAPNAGVLDVAVNTADFTAVVQEIINRAGWASGNAIMILLRETAGTAGESADYYFYEDSTTKAALLTINYTVPAVTFIPKIMMS